MKAKKSLSVRIIMVLAISLVVLLLVYLTGRYGWKLLGFRACQGAGISSVEVSDQAVQITGFYPGSFPEGFCGCISREQNGTLYVGFRFSAVFGSLVTGDFTVTIPVKGEIKQVILKTGTGETTIWLTQSENITEEKTDDG
ncbi:MAG: hypothetical protein ACI3VA_07825 [Candidatus Limivicinus sp.]